MFQNCELFQSEAHRVPAWPPSTSAFSSFAPQSQEREAGFCLKNGIGDASYPWATGASREPLNIMNVVLNTRSISSTRLPRTCPLPWSSGSCATRFAIPDFHVKHVHQAGAVLRAVSYCNGPVCQAATLSALAGQSWPPALLRAFLFPRSRVGCVVGLQPCLPSSR